VIPHHGNIIDFQVDILDWDPKNPENTKEKLIEEIPRFELMDMEEEQ